LQRVETIKKQVEEDKKALLGYGLHPYYFKNSIGKILVTTLDTSGLLDNVEAIHDLEGHMRLVKLQLDILQTGTKEADLERLLAKHPDPYTNKPLHFDNKKGLVVFNGRARSQDNVYQVSVSPVF